MTDGLSSREAMAPSPPTGVGKRVALGLIALLGAAICATRPTLQPVPDELLLLFGVVLCVYALTVALALYPLPWISRRIEAFFEGVVAHNQTGWYFVVALAHFARAEFDSALGRGAHAFSLRETLLGWLTSHLVGFSADSFLNALWASLWPIRDIEAHGALATGVFALVVYGLYALGTRTFGEARFGAPNEDDPEGAPELN